MKKKSSKYLSYLKTNILEYETNKITVIHNTKIVYTLRILQTIILLYVFIYSLWYKRGYQDSYDLSSSIVLKLKGFGLANRQNVRRMIWDVADSVVPPQEENALFITTNVIETYNQTQGKCPENPNVTNAKCNQDSDCQKDTTLYLGNGIMTGKCVKGTTTNKTCEIIAWCPLENSSNFSFHEPLIKKVSDYTVLIKNTIIFDHINMQKSNLFAWSDNLIPNRCIFNASDNLLKYCPIFKVSSFIGSISEMDLKELHIYGGILRIIITWNCNLDLSHDRCRPEYTFERLFTKYGNFSRGWNFRYANYYERDNKEYRTLYKVYGLRILIEVRGNGYKFSIFTCSMNIGSGIGLLAIATVVCDLIMTWFLPKRKQYCEFIYDNFNIKDFSQTEMKTKNQKISAEKEMIPLGEKI